MEKFKFILFSIVVLSLLGFLGYWSVFTLQSGAEYALSQKVKQLEKENEDLKVEVKKLADGQEVSSPKLEESAPSVEKDGEVTVHKYQTLIDEFQKLINNKVFLKLKSRGSNVGVAQKFLNIYNNTSNKIDNDYGADTMKAMAVFQKDVGLNADGEAGSDTFNKIIDWLKEQV